MHPHVKSLLFGAWLSGRWALNGGARSMWVACIIDSHSGPGIAVALECGLLDSSGR